MNRLLRPSLLLLACAAAAGPAPAAAQEKAPPPLLVRAGTVIPVEGAPISPGAVLCRDGRIVALGRPGDVSAEGATVVDLGPGSVLVPGLVAVSSGLAAPGAGGPESLSPEVRAIDGFDWFKPTRRALEGGVTTAYLDAGRRRVLGGQGAVVKLAGASPEARTLVARAGLFGAVGDPARNPPALFDAPDRPDPVAHPLLPVRPQSPGSRMAAVAMLREALARGKAAGTGAAEADGTAALAAVAAGSEPLRLRADDAADLRAALALAQETGVRVVLAGARDAGLLADEIAAAGAPVALLSPFVPGAVSDPWDPEEAVRTAASMGNPAALAAKGVLFAIAAEDAALPDLMMVAAAHVRSGLTADRALRAVTLDAARILGVEKRVGSLVVGKDADLAVFSGDPFDARSSAVLTVVDGVVVFRREPAEGVTVIRAGVVHTGTGVVYAPGAVAVEGGRIIEVGFEVGVPPGATVLERPDGVLLPGFVDGHSRLGLRASGAAGSAGNLGTEVAILSALVPEDASFLAAREAGVTTALVTPGGRGPVVGTAAVVKTGGGSMKERTLSDGGIEVSLAGVPDLPASLQNLRDTVAAAKKHHEAWEKYAKDQKEYEKAKKEYEDAKAKREEEEKDAKAPSDPPKDEKKDDRKPEKKPDLVEPKEPGKPGENPALDAWRDLFRGKGRLFCRASSAAEVLGAIKVLHEESKLPLVLVQADEAWRVAGELKKAALGVLLGPRVTFADRGKTVNAARALASEGVVFGFASDAGMGSRDLPLLAAWAVRHGLGPAAAVRALTLDAAKVLGVADRVGSLEAGKDADMVLFSGDPFRASSRVRAVWIGGKAVFVEE